MNASESVPEAAERRDRPLGARGQATRRRLLEAAEEVFLRHGYHEASVVKITETAGVSHGSLYTYFDGKQEIFDELILDLNRRLRHELTEAAAQAEDRLEAERLGFHAFVDFTREHPAIYRVIRQAEFASPAVMQKHYELIADGYRAGLSESMRRGEIVEMDPEVLAWCLMGLSEMVAMRWCLWQGDGQPEGSAEQAIDEAWQVVVRALSVKPEDATPAKRRTPSSR